MSAPENDARVQALRGSGLTLVTLPRRVECADELANAVAAFTEDTAIPAAVSSAAWLRERASVEYDSARSYVWVGDGRLHGFCAVSTGMFRCEPADRTEMDVGPYPLPAVLLAQAARSRGGHLERNAILQSALGVAESIRGRVAVAALILDPFDEPTGRMWASSGFRPTADKPPKGRQQRLWRALTS